jgi:hypothetical protein
MNGGDKASEKTYNPASTLHPQPRDFEVLQPKLEWQRCGTVEILALRPVTLRGHATRQRDERLPARGKELKVWLWVAITCIHVPVSEMAEPMM